MEWTHPLITLFVPVLVRASDLVYNGPQSNTLHTCPLVLLALSGRSDYARRPIAEKTA
jgi:hypothetical protein